MGSYRAGVGDRRLKRLRIACNHIIGAEALHELMQPRMTTMLGA